MALRHRLRSLNHKIRLSGDEHKHEQTDAWSNRDLIPLPPERRTWGWFNYYGFWAIASLNLANWQTPSTFLGWNGGRLVAVCLTAIWPSYARIPNTFSPNFPATTEQFVGFVIFWFLSTPFLWLRPEKFKIPFLIICVWCGVGMISWMIWAVVTAKGVGPLWYSGQNVPSTSEWNTSWLIMAGINQSVGGLAAGITNGSDFSRYAKARRSYVCGTITSCVITGVLVSLIGLVTAASGQKLYGEVYWNPPDLLLRIMDNGNGSSRSRAGVFFLAAGFAFTAMFENICGNSIAGGIDLAGLFPRYIDIRRGAIITFLAAWVVQPWQLINRATTFVAVLSSFSVFLAPIMGIMACDYYVLRKRKVRLTHLYRTEHSSYYFFKGFNWRAIPSWLCGWIPTIGGLVVTVRGDAEPSRTLLELYYMAFLIGFFISATLFYLLNLFFPVADMDQMDPVDVYGTFTEAEARRVGVTPLADNTIVGEVPVRRSTGEHVILKEKDVEAGMVI
ncbi:ncs1 nucleoside transporter family protein [Curvularia clavata]|uniref:Ncs1 nucleoside transporter family protein n=1 Tax=Curvularia clavata TaxID=95742 RepID=A0A9Q8Z7G3_CURCL|nr:ncs1 nucleoside transporter family protein [Curvularia clavata]